MTEVLFPENIGEAVSLLADHEDARPISGGATLVAMRNAGLVEVSHLVSLDRIAGLSGIEVHQRDPSFPLMTHLALSHTWCRGGAFGECMGEPNSRL